MNVLQYKKGADLGNPNRPQNMMFQGKPVTVRFLAKKDDGFLPAQDDRDPKTVYFAILDEQHRMIRRCTGQVLPDSLQILFVEGTWEANDLRILLHRKQQAAEVACVLRG
jgi:hypothetical protein